MINVTFIPENITVTAAPGSPLLEAAKAAGISVETPCGGKGVCGKCLVKIESGAVDFQNNGILPEHMVRDGFVLICTSKAADSDVIVRNFYDLENESGQFSDSFEDYFKIDSDLKPRENGLSFIASPVDITVPAPKAGDGLSDYDRLLLCFPDEAVTAPLDVLRKLPSVLRRDGGRLWVVTYKNGQNTVVSDIFTGDKPNLYAVCIDVGTTTVAVQLIDGNGHMIASKTAYNAQVECGLDVISRINYAKKPERLSELRDKAVDTVNGLISDLCDSRSVDARNIFNVSVAANPTMTQLLLEIEPEYLRLEPYTPAIHGVPLVTAGEIGLRAHERCPVDFAPAVGSYVGGDITAGILCTRLAAESEELCLFIDVGTNGEIMLGNSDFLMGCACSAGPAFEGGGIDCGMRASSGAIEKVEIDDRGIPEVSVIGGKSPEGICGSGMISLIAELFRRGIIDAQGKFNRESSPNITVSGRVASYTLAESGGKIISVSETDIDNIIRAKAAIFSACRVMLGSVGMGFGDISKFYIAGGFGRFLDIDNAKIIGLIPNLPRERFVFLGNSSLMGSYMSLISGNHRNLRDELAKKTTYLDLSTEAGYMDEYMAALFLPHTDGRLFE